MEVTESLAVMVIVCMGVLGFLVVALVLGILAATRVGNQYTEELIRSLVGEIQDAREATERVCEKMIDPGVIHRHCAERAETKSQSLPAQIKMWNPPPEAYEPPETGPVEEQFTIPRG